MPRNETTSEPARRLRRNATPAEKALWQRLRRRQVGGVKFRWQPWLPGDYYADFCCIEERLVVEVDEIHHAQPGYEQADERRTQSLRGEGYEVIRFSNAAVVGDPDRVVAQIAKAIEEQRIRRPCRPRRMAGR